MASPRIRVTKLFDIYGRMITEWYGHEVSVFEKARSAVALDQRAFPSDVTFEETEGGDFFCVDDELVAYLETFYVPSTPRLRAPFGKDQSAARPVAMEVV